MRRARKWQWRSAYERFALALDPGDVTGQGATGMSGGLYCRVVVETRQPTRWPTSIWSWLAFGLAIAMYWYVGTFCEGGRLFPRPIVTTAMVAWPMLLGMARRSPLSSRNGGAAGPLAPSNSWPCA